MPLWRTKSGKWRIRYYRDGTKAGGRVMETLPARLTFAEADRAYKLRLAKAAGRRGLAQHHELTMEQAVELYLSGQEGTWAPGTLKNIGSTLRANVSRLMGTKLVATLKPEDFADYQRARTAEKAKPSTTNHEIEALRAMFNQLVRWRRLDESPLAPGTVRPLRAPKGRTDFFSPEEWRSFLAALAVHYPPRGKARVAQTAPTIPYFRALLYTGVRYSELLRLRWRDVDLDADRIIFDRSKTDSVSGLKIAPQLRTVLEALPRGGPEELVFLKPDGNPWAEHNIRDAFEKARDLVGLRRTLTIHSVRHTFGSWLTMAGVPLKTISALMGHTSVKMTERYLHLSPAHLGAAIDRIGEAEEGLFEVRSQPRDTETERIH